MNKKKSILLLTNKKSKKKILHLIKKYFKDFKINIKLFSNPNKKYNLKYKKKSLDYIINFNSYFILKKRHLNVAKNCCLNFHPAPPKYRGRGSINYALFNNDKKFGVTCHIIDEKIDHGPIINVMYFDVPKSSNVKKLFDLTKSKLFVLAKNTFKGMNSSSKYINKMLILSRQEMFLHLCKFPLGPHVLEVIS